MISFLEAVNENVKDACVFLDLDEITTQTLLTPKREVTVNFNVRMDNGEMKRFTGFRVQHSTATGPSKGGLRYHPDETIDTVRSLASLMNWKVSLAGLPLSGAKGGVVCNVKKLSKRELEGVSRNYMRAIADFVGPEIDIPAPDVYTDGQVMAWLLDEYETIVRKNCPGVITGKPIVLGGSAGRGNATALGGMYALREAANHLDIHLSHATVAIQGFGNAGMNAAKLVCDMFDSVLIAASDSKGGILNRHGINPYTLDIFKTKTGSVVGYPESIPITQEELLTLDVDVLIPSALENVITVDNAADVKAKIIVELANGPSTPEADKILYANGVHLIPDFLANSGGVIVSHFESVQNRMAHYWSEAEVYKLLNEKINQMYNDVWVVSQTKNIHMRKAAFTIAVSRVVQAMRLRGQI